MLGVTIFCVWFLAMLGLGLFAMHRGKARRKSAVASVNNESHLGDASPADIASADTTPAGITATASSIEEAIASVVEGNSRMIAEAAKVAAAVSEVIGSRQAEVAKPFLRHQIVKRFDRMHPTQRILFIRGSDGKFVKAIVASPDEFSVAGNDPNMGLAKPGQ